MYHLICVHPFQLAGKNYAKGQRVTDPDEIETLSNDREHHFVRVAAS